MAEIAPRLPLSQNEAAALGVAVLGHVALVLALIYFKPADLPPPPPERMEVTISDETGLVSTSPDPQADPALDSGPVVGDMAPPPMPEPLEIAQAQPRPVPAPMPRPLVQSKVQPQAKPAPRPQTQNQRNTTPPRPGTKPGASRFDQAFGQGVPGAMPTGKSRNQPAAQASAQQVASWDSSIKAKVVSRWDSCPVSGLDTNKLKATVRFTLRPDGGILSLDEPVITGITDANRAQVRPFRDCAVRSIRLAAPFTGMPQEFYDQWKPRKLNFTK